MNTASWASHEHVNKQKDSTEPWKLQGLKMVVDHYGLEVEDLKAYVETQSQDCSYVCVTAEKLKKRNKIIKSLNSWDSLYGVFFKLV